jgi:asparagine synthase (glutamine-hydrolysing)
MCGIYGYYSFSGIGQDVQVGEEATDRLRHRGPDEKGSWSDNGVFLGMRRLSIIDLAGGQQPIWNEDKTCCIVYNGELYNFMDLRPQLEAQGHLFRTRSDTEVILHGYEEWGHDCLKKFNGMFAFAIWDNIKRTLFLARDRIGEKPLYYYIDKDRFIFASEIKAIITDKTVPRELNPRGLANFLSFGHAVAPDTMYRDIYKLLPGHSLLVHDGKTVIRQYWDVGDEPQLAKTTILSKNQYIEEIIKLVDDSVRRRMIADVPVGAFLSGGVDSSAVVALMKRHASGPVKTFSLGFDVGGAYNELADARRVSEFLQTEHYELNVSHADLKDLLLKLVYHYDEPFGDAAGFPVYLLSQFARQHVKVVLAGDGGDEIFGGYRRYAADQYAASYQLLPRWLTDNFIPSLVDKMPRLRRTKRTVQTLPIRDAAARYASWLICFTPEMQEELVQSELLWQQMRNYDSIWPYPYFYAGPKKVGNKDHINTLLYIDLKTWLPDAYMEKVDKATMACSLEARLPLLDHRLVELAFQIPSSFKLSHWKAKKIFKEAVAGLIPGEVLRKPKHGFAVPTDPWFRGGLKSFTYEILLDGRTRQRKYFNMPMVERLWREHQAGRHIWDTQLWLLLNFELWHRIFIDNDNLSLG